MDRRIARFARGLALASLLAATVVVAPLRAADGAAEAEVRAAGPAATRAESASPAVDKAAVNVVTLPDSAALGAPAAPFPLEDRPLSPLMQAIRAAWEQSELERHRLEEAVDRATTPEGAVKAQRDLEAALRGFEIRVLQIQADFARREGRIEQAQEIEAAIQRITSPPDLRHPADRPAPDGWHWRGAP